MRNYFTTACLSLAIVSCGGILPAAPRAEAAEPSVAAAAEQALAPERAFVRLWQKPGAFAEAKFATVKGDTLYIAGALRGLQAVDLETGVPRWTYLGELPLDFPPTELSKVLYLVEGGQLVRLNQETGAELSRGRTRLGFLTPLFPGEDHGLVGSGDKGGYVYSIESNTGVKLLRHALDGIPVSSAWDGGDVAYFLSIKGTIYGSSIRTQQLTWNHPFPKEFCSPPTYDDKSLYVGCSDFYLYSIDAAVGTLQWKTSLSAPVLGQPVVVGPRVYAATTDKLIHAVDLKTHDDLWTVAGERVLTGTPEHILFLGKSPAGRWIGMADAKTGKVISRVTAADQVVFAAVPDSGVFYSIGKNGDVLAIADRAAVRAGKAGKKARVELAEEEAIPAPAVHDTAAPPAAPEAPAPSVAPSAPAPATPPAPAAPAPKP